ncbi:hypothetical protein AVEN_257853-1 [Araneus ventricosus]|uniref:ribonuclease H n=1 Tax=Araneus ventricosus TaxID=182803 RepID=A0A4Y2EEI5_ARAVE|nr:hypothetical protein AVEN_257853-1 [Araneus ventricosus]
MPGDEVIGDSFRPFLFEVWHWLPHMTRYCENTLRGIVQCRANSTTTSIIAVRQCTKSNTVKALRSSVENATHVRVYSIVSEHLSPTQISLDDGGNINSGLRIYTDGSKTEKGMGAAFCVLTDVNIIHRWSTRLSLRNTVFQAEILALLKAVEHAVALPTQQLTILVNNQASIKSAANPNSHNSIARKIFKLLHSHPHIRVACIKAHAGYIGNQEADRLAKEAAETENFPETLLEFPKSFIKTFLRQKMLATWQMAWDDGDSGRLIHNVIPKVQTNQLDTQRSFVFHRTWAFPFVSPKIQPCQNYSCGGIGTPIHYATVCLLTTSYHMTPPIQPTTSASMVPQSSQQFNVKKEDT